MFIKSVCEISVYAYIFNGVYEKLDFQVEAQYSMASLKCKSVSLGLSAIYYNYIPLQIVLQ